MKKIFYLLTVAFLINTTSCNDDFLSQQPLDKFGEDAVWQDLALIETFVNDIYAGIPHGHSNIMLSSAADETMYNADFGSSNITKSLVTPSDLGLFSADYWVANRYRQMSWKSIYKYVRAANLFFEKIDETPFEDEAMKNRLTGEVHFLRAYHYHNLVFTHGGVPIIDKAYDLGDDYLAPRNSFKECIDFIISDLDAAANLLPLNFNDATSEQGRATKGAALALKARVLLYAASDLYHTTSWAGGYSNPEFITYEGDRNALYQGALDAAQAVIDLNQYALYKEGQATDSASAAQNYSEIFLTKGTSEDIFLRYFISKSTEDWHGYNPGLFNTPNGYHGWGSNTPIQQLVDDYEMRDGTPFDWSDPQHAANPYKNRDPRFYASILYNGVKWRKRPADVVASDPVGVIQTGFWEVWNASKNAKEEKPGLDTRKGPIEDWNGTHTGYYTRKFLDPSVDAQYVVQELPWRFIRFTEVLLIKAEALIALGQEDDAREIINTIRARVNMPAIADTGTDLVERLRNERRIELAFEDHRFFDIRRWMIAPNVHDNAKGINIRYPLNPDKTTSTIPDYSIVNVQDRAWNNRFYFLPIGLDEMNKNDQLVQNPLY
jgi:starch-binding outer membrane protein, SusD/RagB family